MATLLVVDDDQFLCSTVGDALGTGSLRVITAHTIAEGRDAARRERCDMVLLDNTLPDGNGVALIPELLAANDRSKIVLMTAFPTFGSAVEALRGGAHDYLSKPFSIEELGVVVAQALRTVDLERVEQVSRYERDRDRTATILLGSGPKMNAVRELMARAAQVNAPVLITGETGTGKNVIARSIHYEGAKRAAPFISVNCAALPETLIEAELFGAERGAYTGAVVARKGTFEIADGGTLLLDEIGELPVALQAKLLGALEDGHVKRIGAERPRPVDVRVIAATNADPERAIAAGSFRRDLFYRLSVIQIHVPPLRERPTDVPQLCDHFLGMFRPGRRVELAEGERERLMAYHWPGNVRELRNVCERCVIVQDGDVMRPSALLGQPLGPTPTPARPSGAVPTLNDVERAHITQVLSALDFNQTRAAGALGISISTLRRKLREYGRA